MHPRAQEQFDVIAAPMLARLLLLAVGLFVLVMLLCFVVEATKPPRWEAIRIEGYLDYERAKFASYKYGVDSLPDMGRYLRK